MSRPIAGIAAVVCSFAAVCASATTLTLNPTDDTYVQESSPSTSSGSSSQLRVRNGDSNDRVAYLRFAVGQFANACNLVNAKLRLRAKTGIQSSGGPVAAHVVSSTSWTQSITWNSRPAIGAALSSTVILSSSLQWYEWDVTTHVRSQYLAGQLAVAFALQVPEASEAEIELQSKESSDDPELVLTTGPLTAGCSGSLVVVADAYTRSDAPNSNAGTSPELKTRVDPERHTYMKVDLTQLSGQITLAKLRIKAHVEAGTMLPAEIFSVTDTSWQESTITWSNQPPASLNALASVTITDDTDRLYEWDVTTYVQAEHAAGRSLVGFSLKGAPPTTTSAEWKFRSREDSDEADKPYLYVELAPSALYFIHVDHLNTPRLVANDQGQTVWKWDQQEPFGVNAADEDPDSNSVAFEFPLRFPGQYADKETGLRYNYYRHYDSTIGRYTESDPMGVDGGMNTYAYVDSDPLKGIDPKGLVRWKGTVYSLGAAGLLGGTLFWFDLKSECVDGHYALIRVFASAVVAGAGIKAGGGLGAVGSSVDFDDSLRSINPAGFQGGFKYCDASLGALLVGGYSIYQLGSNTSYLSLLDPAQKGRNRFAPQASLGVAAFAGCGAGRSAIVSTEIKSCGCP